MPRERIVAAARALVDDKGAQALTMRALAHQLQTSPTVLYRAVRDRAELIDLIVDQTFADITFEFEGSDWQADSHAAARAIFAALKAHKGVAPLLIERVPTGPHAVMMRERILAMLLSHGFSITEAPMVFATLARFVIGFAAQMKVPKLTDHSEAPRLVELYLSMDTSRFPATVAVADTLPNQTLDEEFEYGLMLLIHGLAATRGKQLP